MLEKDFEDILVKYPELIEEGLRLKSRQETVFGRRMDLYFEDINNRQLIVELKSGPILDKHIGQILAYEGSALLQDKPDIRIMLIGTRVPPNIRKALDHHGIAWREINFTTIISFLKEKADNSFSHIFPDDIKIKSYPGSKSMLSEETLGRKTKAIPLGVDKDKFGFRLNTMASRGAAMVAEGGHTMKEIIAVNPVAHKMVKMMKDRGWLVIKDSEGKYSISGKVENSDMDLATKG